MTGYYDMVLGIIPAALIGITAILLATGLPLALAVPTGAAVSMGVMAHALFVRTPISAPERRGPRHVPVSE